YSFCQKQMLPVELADIESWTTQKRFSVITICDVLEHVKDPMAVLKKCHQLLMPNGVIYVQVPCVLGLRYPFRANLGLPHHLWQFAPKTLARLIKSSQFSSVKYWTGVQGI